jgi:brefeldin A-inhibited guanine nucleotide-exchange protein
VVSSWRKHSKLVQECKVVLEKLSATLPPTKQHEQQTKTLSVTPLADGSVSFSLDDAEIILQPLIVACDSGFVKMVEPALECIQKLIANGYITGEADMTYYLKDSWGLPSAGREDLL